MDLLFLVLDVIYVNPPRYQKNNVNYIKIDILKIFFGKILIKHKADRICIKYSKKP